MRKKDDRAGDTQIKRIAVGVVLGYAVSLAVAAVLSLLISKGTLGEELLKTGSVAAAYLGALVGAFSVRRRGERAAATIGAVTGAMLILRFVIAAFGGESSLLSKDGLSIGSAILLGGITVLATCAKLKRRRRTARR